MSDTTPGGSTPDVPPTPAPPAYGSPTPPPAPGYGAPAYGAPAYGAPAYPQAPSPYGAPGYGSYAAEPKTNVLAVISMIASIVGAVWILPIVGSLAGAIMGHIALKQIKTSGEKGRGMALAGVIVGWVGLGLAVIGAIAFIAFFSWAAAQGVRYST